ncbi:MAG: serine/threonine-protein kinase [Polyangiaceae bacterium]
MRADVGDVLDSRYRLIAKVGAGAYGVVFRARDLETRGEVAVKVLKSESTQDAALSVRFEREAMAMARLRGTSAVYVHGMGRLPDGSAYIVMEMLYGTDLETFLSAAEKQGGRLKRSHTLSLLGPIAQTLDAAHRQKIVHRDLKPSNIFLVDRSHGGGVRLMDFGLAKLLGAGSLTAQGMVAGTPSYIAPESWRGDPRTLDHRIDVYSLGVIVFRCLAGRVPHTTKSMMELCQWAQTGERPSLTALRPSLPGAMDPWVQRSLAIDPDKRFQSVRELWQSLEGILAPQQASRPW